MDILICTHGRRNRQITYENFTDVVKDRIRFVVQESEADQWEGMKTVILPPHIKTLPDTRQWLVENRGNKICMLDDDLVFSVRRNDEPTKFRKHTHYEELEAMFTDIEDCLDQVAHVGVSHREGANRNVEPYLHNGRYMRVIAYRTDILNAEGIKCNRTPDVEDFDVNLQLLRKGYPSIILNRFVHNQGGSDQTGGCSGYRTPETHTRDVNLLAKAHPGFVKVVKKKTKDRWCADENGERTDVRIQWKKAFESAGEVKDV